jgi:hypothetical protein
MTDRIKVTIEHSPKKTFATAADWPGWSRSGKTEELALAELVDHGSRYAPVAAAADLTFPATVALGDLTVAERIAGGSGTEFGVPSRPTKRDARPTTPNDAERLARLIDAAWGYFDRTVRAAPRELRLGSRGGGRDTPRIVAHVLDSDRAYANEIGVKVREFAPDDGRAIVAMRSAMLEVIRAARDGQPLADRRWPARYAAHRIAWHALDHAWEIEDRTD